MWWIIDMRANELFKKPIQIFVFMFLVLFILPLKNEITH